MVQLELFDKPKEDYETNENPMVRKYGLTWNFAKCGVITNKPRTLPCRYYDSQKNRCQLRRGKHNPRWQACGKYQPRRGNPS
jgi:hypothetical protein